MFQASTRLYSKSLDLPRLKRQGLQFPPADSGRRCWPECGAWRGEGPAQPQLPLLLSDSLAPALPPLPPLEKKKP